MNRQVSQMTDVELRQMIGDVVEEKLLALLGDSEDELEINDELRARLESQTEAIKNGERGEDFEAVVARLGLN